MPSRQAELENREKRQREVLAMHERGMTLREIGAAISRSPEVARGILQQARWRAERLERWQQVQALARTGNREELLAVPLDDVVFDPEDYRVRAVFANDGLETLGDLLDKHPIELLRAPNFGRRSLNAVREALASLGLVLDQPRATTWLQPPPPRLFVNGVGAWQPIETAPKDGTRVLLFDQYERSHGFACFVGSYHQQDISQEGWYAIPGAYRKRPSHWLPLPEPPK